MRRMPIKRYIYGAPIPTEAVVVEDIELGEELGRLTFEEGCFRYTFEKEDTVVYGLGESGVEIISCIKKLASLGVVPTLRKIRIDDLNIDNINRFSNRGRISVTSDKMIDLARKQKEILKNYGLSTKSFNTMCHKCSCCDIVPFRDI